MEELYEYNGEQYTRAELEEVYGDNTDSKITEHGIKKVSSVGKTKPVANSGASATGTTKAPVKKEVTKPKSGFNYGTSSLDSPTKKSSEYQPLVYKSAGNKSKPEVTNKPIETTKPQTFEQKPTKYAWEKDEFNFKEEGLSQTGKLQKTIKNTTDAELNLKAEKELKLRELKRHDKVAYDIYNSGASEITKEQNEQIERQIKLGLDMYGKKIEESISSVRGVGGSGDVAPRATTITKISNDFKEQEDQIVQELKSAGVLNKYTKEKVKEMAVERFKQEKILEQKKINLEKYLDSQKDLSKESKQKIQEAIESRSKYEHTSIKRKSLENEYSYVATKAELERANKIVEELKITTDADGKPVIGVKPTTQAEVDYINSKISQLRSIHETTEAAQRNVQKNLSDIDKSKDDLSTVDQELQAYKKNYNLYGEMQRIASPFAKLATTFGVLAAASEDIMSPSRWYDLIVKNEDLLGGKGFVTMSRFSSAVDEHYDSSIPESHTFIGKSYDFVVEQLPNLAIMAATGGGATVAEVAATQVTKSAIGRIGSALALSRPLSAMAFTSGATTFNDLTKGNLSGETDYNLAQIVLMSAVSGYVEGYSEIPTEKMFNGSKRIFKSYIKESAKKFGTDKLGYFSRFTGGELSSGRFIGTKFQYAGHLANKGIGGALEYVGDTAFETLGEDASLIANACAEALILGKPMDMKEIKQGLDENLHASASLSAFLGAAPHLAGLLVRPLQTRDNVHEMYKNHTELLELTKMLDDISIPESTKNIIKEKIVTISNEVAENTRKLVKRYDNLSMDNIGTIDKNVKRMSELKEEASKLKEDGSESAKKAFDTLKEEFDSLNRENEIITQAAEFTDKIDANLDKEGYNELVNHYIDYIKFRDYKEKNKDNSLLKESISAQEKEISQKYALLVQKHNINNVDKAIESLVKTHKFDYQKKSYKDADSMVKGYESEIDGLVSSGFLTKEEADEIRGDMEKGQWLTKLDENGEVVYETDKNGDKIKLELHGTHVPIVNKKGEVKDFIFINESSSDLGTLMHESFHLLLARSFGKSTGLKASALNTLLLDHLRENNPELYEEVSTSLEKTYAGAEKAVKDEEYLAHIIEHMSELKDFEFKKGTFGKFKDSLLSIVDPSNGPMFGNIKINNGKDVFNFLNNLNKGLMTGKPNRLAKKLLSDKIDIKEKDGAVLKGTNKKTKDAKSGLSASKSSKPITDFINSQQKRVKGVSTKDSMSLLGSLRDSIENFWGKVSDDLINVMYRQIDYAEDVVDDRDYELRQLAEQIRNVAREEGRKPSEDDMLLFKMTKSMHDGLNLETLKSAEERVNNIGNGIKFSKSKKPVATKKDLELEKSTLIKQNMEIVSRNSGKEMNPMHKKIIDKNVERVKEINSLLEELARPTDTPGSVSQKNVDISNKNNELMKMLKDDKTPDRTKDKIKSDLINLNRGLIDNLVKRKFDSTQEGAMTREDFKDELIVEFLKIVETYKPEKNPNFGAYVNGMLPKRVARILEKSGTVKTTAGQDRAFTNDLSDQGAKQLMSDEAEFELNEVKKRKKALHEAMGLTEEVMGTIETSVRKTFGSRLPSMQSKDFKQELKEMFRMQIRPELTKHFGPNKMFKQYVYANWNTLYDALPLSTILKRFKQFSSPVLDANGKQKRETFMMDGNGNGKKLFEKRKIDKEEFVNYFFGANVGVSTQGTRKTALIDTLSEELAYDASVDMFGSDVEFRKNFEDKQEIMGYLLADNYISEIAKKLDRDTPNIKFSKSSRFGQNSFSSKLWQFKAAEAVRGELTTALVKNASSTNPVSRFDVIKGVLNNNKAKINKALSGLIDTGKYMENKLRIGKSNKFKEVPLLHNVSTPLVEYIDNIYANGFDLNKQEAELAEQLNNFFEERKSSVEATLAERNVNTTVGKYKFDSGFVSKETLDEGFDTLYNRLETMGYSAADISYLFREEGYNKNVRSRLDVRNKKNVNKTNKLKDHIPFATASIASKTTLKTVIKYNLKSDQMKDMVRDVLNDLKEGFEAGVYSKSQVKAVVNILGFANNRSILANSARVEYTSLDVYSGEGGKRIYEHVAPTSFTKNAVLNSILGKSDVTINVILEKHVACLTPKLMDDNINKHYKKDMPDWWDYSTHVLFRYFNEKTFNGYVEPIVELKTGLVYGTNFIANQGVDGFNPDQKHLLTDVVPVQMLLGDSNIEVNDNFIQERLSKIKTTDKSANLILREFESLTRTNKGLAVRGDLKMRMSKSRMIDLNNKAAKVRVNSRNVNVDVKKIRVFDFDDTLATSKSRTKYTMPDGQTGFLTPEEFAHKAHDLKQQGAEFDFSEFTKVIDGKPAPMMKVVENIINARGNEDVFILTARPAESAFAIKEFLDGVGVNLKIENIVGLGNSTAEAKALWMVEKAHEGYNDFYFADDVENNVKAVKDALEVFDVKSRTQQARIKYSKSQSFKFNQILNDKKGVPVFKKFSAAAAFEQGYGKGRFKFFVPPNSEDFVGLLYSFLPKGKSGEEAMGFFKQSLIDPFTRAMKELDEYKIFVLEEFKWLKKEYGVKSSFLKSKVPGSDFTWDQAVRIYLWNRQGQTVPSISEKDVKKLVSAVKKDIRVNEFAYAIASMTGYDGGYVPLDKNWLGGTIGTDILSYVNGEKRQEFLGEWNENVKEIFSEDNMNKVEALYGRKYKLALENSLKRMKSGRNRINGTDATTNRVTDWLNGATAVVMFFNVRSAVLQTISATNYLNWSDNNPISAAAAFANQKQFWGDFMELYNHDFLKERRGGLKMDVAADEIAEQAAGKGGVRKALAWLLEKGFLPTKHADSFAIAYGGSTFYRNRMKTYIKEGLSEKEAKDKAITDWMDVTEESQQSSRPDKISQIQASPLGRFVFAFANTPMQYTRLTKKAFLDLTQGRGDWKTNMSKLAYYSVIQNIIFSSMQNALFTMMFDDDDDEYDFFADKKAAATVNGILDTLLRGSGLYGAIMSTVKNAAIKYYDQEQSGRPDPYAVPVELMSISPPVKTKIDKLVSARKSTIYKQEKEKMQQLGWSLDNPAYMASARVVSAATNLPADRILQKIENLRTMSDENVEDWQRVMLFLGYSKWNLGIEGKEPEEILDRFSTKDQKKFDKVKRINPDLTEEQFEKLYNIEPNVAKPKKEKKPNKTWLNVFNPEKELEKKDMETMSKRQRIKFEKKKKINPDLTEEQFFKLYNEDPNEYEKKKKEKEEKKNKPKFRYDTD